SPRRRRWPWPRIRTSARVCSPCFQGWRRGDICVANPPAPPADPFTASPIRGLIEHPRRTRMKTLLRGMVAALVLVPPMARADRADRRERRAERLHRQGERREKHGERREQRGENLVQKREATDRRAEVRRAAGHVKAANAPEAAAGRRARRGARPAP